MVALRPRHGVGVENSTATTDSSTAMPSESAPPPPPWFAKKPPGVTEVEFIGDSMMGVEWFTVALCTLVVVGRLYTRARITRSVGLEDWLPPLATLCLINTVILHQLGVSRREIGIHIYDFKPRMLGRWDMAVFAWGQSLYPVATGLVRVSVLLFVRRLNTYPFFGKIVLWNIWLNVIYTPLAVCSITFRCIPLDAAYNPMGPPPGSKCLEYISMGKLNMSVSMALDVITWTLPATLVYRVPAPLKDKLIMTPLLCIGFLACIAGSVRIPATLKSYYSHDPTWDNVAVCICVILEISIGIVAASLPAIKPLFSLMRTRLASKVSSSGRNSATEIPLDSPLPPPSVARKGTRKMESTEALWSIDEIEIGRLCSKETKEAVITT